MAARRPPERSNLYLIGMMGSGKTTLGRLLAQALERPFLDTDELVELREGRTIPQIFEEEGEAYFREVEARCVLEASRLGGAVVALGGGAVLREANRRVLKATGRSIYLKVRPETILARLPEHPARPLITAVDVEERLALLRRLLAAREPYYLQQADLVVENEGPPEAALRSILRELRRRGWLPP